MPNFDQLLARWRNAGVLDSQSEARIRAFEDAQEKFSMAGIRWQGMIALALGAILLACGVALFISARWDEFSPGVRLAIALGMVAAVHLAGGLVRERFVALSRALHGVGTMAAVAAIAITAQIFNMEGHWPTVVLLWALAAACGWLMLRDQVQQSLTLLLAPAWMLSELSDAMAGHIGAYAFTGRLIFVWAVLYLTFFVKSERRLVRATLFSVAAIAAVIGTLNMTSGWISFSSTQTFVPFSTRMWAWAAIAALPLLIAAFHGHKGLVPITLAVVYAISMPWCNRVWTEIDTFGAVQRTITRSEPSLAAYAIASLFALLLCLWGVRIASRALVNLGIVYFGVAVAWFYFSSIFDKLSRSLGLIAFGVLFLAAGWVLEKMRRRLLSRLDSANSAAVEAR
jgi:uncharacterized membrane protein